MFRNLFTWQLVGGFAVAIVIMFIHFPLVWMYEHPINEKCGPLLPQGFGGVALVDGQHFPRRRSGQQRAGRTGGRIIATLWMLVSVMRSRFLPPH